MRKLSVLALALPLFLTLPAQATSVAQDMPAYEEQDASRARIKSIASVSWREKRTLNIRVFECDGEKVFTRSYTGEKKHGDWVGKWIKQGGFETKGENVAACSWVEGDKVHIRVFVSGEGRDLVEHRYEGNADVKIGEKDTGTWTVGKTFRGETASVDVDFRKGDAIMNLFIGDRKGRLTYFTQQEGKDWKEVDL